MLFFENRIWLIICVVVWIVPAAHVSVLNVVTEVYRIHIHRVQVKSGLRQPSPNTSIYTVPVWVSLST